MANVRISDLAETTNLTGSEFVEVSQGGLSRKARSDLFAAIVVPSNGASLILTANNPVDLVDTAVALNVGATDPDTLQHLEFSSNEIQSKGDATSPQPISINPFGGDVRIGDQNGSTGDITEFYQSSFVRMSVEDFGIKIAGDDIGDPSVPDAIGTRIELESRDANLYATFGYDATSVLNFTNEAEGSGIQLRAVDTTSTLRVLFAGLPDGTSQMHFAGTPTLRTVDPTAGGAEAQNTDTGVGWERVLTLSDIAGVGDTIIVEDEGVVVGVPATNLNFTGSGVSVVDNGATKDIVISGVSAGTVAGDLVAWDGVSAYITPTGVRMPSTATPPTQDSGYIVLGTTGTVNERQPQMQWSALNTVSVHYYAQTDADPDGFYLRTRGNLGTPTHSWGWSDNGTDVDIFRIDSDGELLYDSPNTAFGMDEVATISQLAGGGNPFNTPLGVRSIGNTDAEARQLLFEHQDGTDRASMGHETGIDLIIRNQITDGEFQVFNENTFVAGQTLLMGGNSETGMRFYAFDNEQVLQCIDSGIEVRGNSDEDGDPFVDNEDQNAIINFGNFSGQFIGSLGWEVTSEMILRNQQRGGGFDFLFINATGGIRAMMDSDPDTLTRIFHPASNEDVLNTTTAAAGGVLVDNQSTGAGLERVLTVSDLAGGGSPFTTPLVVESAGNTTTEARLFEYALDNGTVVGRSGYVADSTLVFENIINTAFIEIAGDDTTDQRQLLIQLQPNTGGEQLYNFPEVGGSINRLRLQALGTVDIAGDLNNDTDTRLITLSHQDGTRRAIIGHNNTTRLDFISEIHGANVLIGGEDAGGTLRTILSADPDSATTLRGDTDLRLEVVAGTELALLANANASTDIYANGIRRLRVEQTGEVQIQSDGNTDTENRILRFAYQNFTNRAQIGHQGSDVFRVSNLIHGGNVDINGEDAGGFTRSFLLGDPDALTTLRGDTGVTITTTAAGSILMQTGGTTRYQIDGVNQRHVFNDYSIFIEERASSPASVAGYGQLWVETDTPNRLKFTDDTDQDFDIAVVGGYVTDNVVINSSFNFNTAGNFAANRILYYADGTNNTITLEDSGSTTNWPVYTSIQVIAPGSGAQTITEGSGTTLFLQDGTDTVGGGTISQGAATIFRASTTDYIYIGDGFTT